MSASNGNRLTPEEINRYSRHVTLPEVGVSGQEKLKAASVLSIGAGGLGSPIGIYLAATGVGRIGVVDDDVVDISNLNRQIAHSTESAGQPKVETIRKRMLEINPLIRVDIYKPRLTRENALELFSQYDIIVDGSDNFQTRYLVNDAAYLTGKPLIYGSIFRFEGQMSVFHPHREGPCYRCLYSNPPPASLLPS